MPGAGVVKAEEERNIMKEIGTYLGLPIFLMVSTWGALSSVVDMTEKLNRMRNSALGLTEADKAIPFDLRYDIFKNDWIPLWICVIGALAILAAIFFLIPALFKTMHQHSKGDEASCARALMAPVRFGFTHIEISCYGLGLLALVACLAVILAGAADLKMVREKALRPSENLQTNRLEVDHSYVITVVSAGDRRFEVAEIKKPQQ